MNEKKSWTIILGIFMVSACIMTCASEYSKYMIASEAVKAGLVQKRDGFGQKPIWVEKETNGNHSKNK